MQASQRSEYNHALEFAIQQANGLNLPVIVYFGITDRYPEANDRHYAFMLQGIQETQASLRDRDINMVIGHESPDKGAIKMAKRASMLICDRGYLKLQRQWRRNVADRVDCPVIQIESDVVVPVEQASGKEEYSAATLRAKIKRQMLTYLVPLTRSVPRRSSLSMQFENYDITDTIDVLAILDIDHTVSIVNTFRGGNNEAQRRLTHFIKSKLDHYQELRNNPTTDNISNMSPYLHFGQVSPLDIALQVLQSGSAGKDSYLDELIIRRELAMNYVFYNQNYVSFEGIPRWAQETLHAHQIDKRTYTYSLVQLENADTHDAYWNAAQREMILTGKMHGYMRMYWGKKILEWSNLPEEAFKTAIYLNNKYEIDGRDPNGYAGVAWCFGKHDRPWATRQVFGSIRYMSSDGLRRKFDTDQYAKKYGPGKS
jgi:deoxyribodipyrimidine photo-lyase